MAFKLRKKKSSDSIIQENFIKYKGVYRRVIRHAKKMYNNATIQKAENKSKASWNIVNSELGRNKTTKTEISCLVNPETGRVTKCPRDIANIFNKYYRDIAKNTNKNKGKRSGVLSKQTCVDNTIFMSEVTEAEVLDAAKKLKN